MPRHPWSKLKSRIEALFAPGLPLAIHCNVFVKHTRHFDFDEPRRFSRGPALEYWETGYGWDGRKPSEPSATIREYLDRPRGRLMQPVHDPWELAAILRAADRRLGRETLLAWSRTLDGAHAALPVIRARFPAPGTAASDAPTADRPATHAKRTS